MPNIPGLRSPYIKVGRLVYFGRMLDKIRLHAAGKLPPDYAENLGESRPNLFDARCCRFLGVKFTELQARTLTGGSDEEVIAWAESTGGLKRNDEDCLIWNRFMSKIGWHDDRREVLEQRIAQSGLQDKNVQCFFDYLDYDEGRDPSVTKPWLTL